MTTLIDVQGIKARTVFAVLVITQELFEPQSSTTFGVGTRREILKAYSPIAASGPNPMGLRSLSGHSLTGEDLLELLATSCSKAITVEDFLIRNKCSGLECHVSQGEEAFHAMVHTSEQLEQWIISLPKDRYMDAVCTGVGVSKFVHDEDNGHKEIPLYVVQQGRKYYEIYNGYGSFSRYTNIFTAAKLTLTEALAILAENPGAALVGPKPVVYALKLTGSYHVGQFVERVSGMGFDATADPRRAQTYTSRSSALKAAQRIPGGNNPVLVRFTYNDDGSDCILDS